MKIQVDVENDILGNHMFWKGDSSKIQEIRNIPARRLAEKVVVDGVKRRDGMWVVYEVKEDE